MAYNWLAAVLSANQVLGFKKSSLINMGFNMGFFVIQAPEPLLLTWFNFNPSIDEW